VKAKCMSTDADMLHCCLHMRNRAHMPAAGSPSFQFKHTVGDEHAWLEAQGRYQDGHRVN